MRIVFDTNVIIAGIVAEGLCREILETHLPEHTPIISQVLWDELVDTLREKFGLRSENLPMLGLYRQLAEWCDAAPLAQAVCRDPDDDWVLATAVAGQAEAIVTGDQDLLLLKKYSGILVLNPRQFVERQPLRPR